MSTINEIYPIPAEIKKLYIFLGDWNVEETIEIGSNMMKLKGKWSFTTALPQLQVDGA